MQKALVIVKREYLQRVRTKGFIIGTILTPLLMLSLSLVPILFATRGGGERQVKVLDQSGEPGLFEAINRRVQGLDETTFRLEHIVVPRDRDLRQLWEEYKAEVREDSDKAVIVLYPKTLDGEDTEYYAKNASDFGIGRLERAISAAITERRLVRAGLDPDRIEHYMRPVNMKTLRVSEEGESEEGGQAFIIALVMLIFIYMSILTYGITVMRGVIEEKQSRIAELIVSSVKPFQMMMGKLVGIGLVGLTQYAIWVGSAVLLIVFGTSLFSRGGFKMPQLSASLAIYFILFFVLGYFLFATLYAMVGSMVSSEEDAQQVQFPVTMLIVMPMIIFWVVMKDPNGPTAVTLSLIPFFAPTLMMLRIAMIQPPLWQVLLSMGLMVLAIVGAVWIAGKIYRVGILMYGKRPSLAELGRWVRYA